VEFIVAGNEFVVLTHDNLTKGASHLVGRSEPVPF
jgi:hypothetical protein